MEGKGDLEHFLFFNYEKLRLFCLFTTVREHPRAFGSGLLLFKVVVICARSGDHRGEGARR